MANNSAMWMGGSTVAAAGVLSLPALILLSVVMVSFSQNVVTECNMQYVNLQSCGIEHFISKTQLTYFGNCTDIIKTSIDALSGICSRIFGTQESISNVREDITYNIH